MVGRGVVVDVDSQCELRCGVSHSAAGLAPVRALQHEGGRLGRHLQLLVNTDEARMKRILLMEVVASHRCSCDSTSPISGSPYSKEVMSIQYWRAY